MMSPPGRPVVVWWVKRDARLLDNAPLAEAARLGVAVLPLFCVEPSLAAATDTSDMHLQAQWQAVGHLRDELRRRGADILIAHGEVTDKLAKLAARVPFTHLFAHEEVGNAVTFRRDVAVADWCRANGVTYQEFPQSSVRRGGVNRDRRHQLWQTRIVATEPLAVPDFWQPADLTRLAAGTAFPKLPAFADRPGWQPVTEAAAHATLYDFVSRRGRWYRGGISSPTRAATAGSRLSVHLAWGTLSARQVWHATRRRVDALDPADPDGMRWRASLEGFLSRLHWRDHFTQRLESEPDLEFRSIHPSYRDVPFEDDPGLFAAWRDGRTGYPLVDAVMRCLATTGFVNFRMRAMVTSFACHALHLDWRLIHPHLAGVFRDYDPGIHLAQLQMQAGVVGWGAVRVYNPAKQLADWDADGRFVHRWVPELRSLSGEQLLVGDRPPGYPPPVVPFAERTRWMTDVLYAVRKTAAAKAATPAVYVRHGSRRPEHRPRRRVVRRASPQPGLFDRVG